MDYTLEKHLREIGILPENFFDELDPIPTHKGPMPKNHFDDPRDENGDVPF